MMFVTADEMQFQFQFLSESIRQYLLQSLQYAMQHITNKIN